MFRLRIFSNRILSHMLCRRSVLSWRRRRVDVLRNCFRALVDRSRRVAVRSAPGFANAAARSRGVGFTTVRTRGSLSLPWRFGFRPAPRQIGRAGRAKSPVGIRTCAVEAPVVFHKDRAHELDHAEDSIHPGSRKTARALRAGQPNDRRQVIGGGES